MFVQQVMQEESEELETTKESLMTKLSVKVNLGMRMAQCFQMMCYNKNKAKEFNRLSKAKQCYQILLEQLTDIAELNKQLEFDLNDIIADVTGKYEAA